MESKMALTTPSTSRCVRSGKSVQSFCTSSERIIGTPLQDLVRPRPLRREPRGYRLSGNFGSRKQDLRGVSQKETPRFPLLLLGFLLGFGGGLAFFFLARSLGGFGRLRLFQGLAKDIAQRRARIG